LRLRCDLGVGEVDQTYYHHRDTEIAETTQRKPEVRAQ